MRSLRVFFHVRHDDTYGLLYRYLVWHAVPTPEQEIFSHRH